MKTKLLVFAMLMTMGVMAAAYDGPEMTIVTGKGSDVFRVIYKGVTSGKVKLNIFDSRGRTIHSAFVAGKDGFICPLNFKGLPSGKYTIEVIDDQGSYQQRVDYVTVHDRKSIHVSKLMDEKGKFLFSIANAQSEPITIKIYDQYQTLLYSVSRTIKGDFAQVFRMAYNLDHYTFHISDAAGNVKYFVF